MVKYNNWVISAILSWTKLKAMNHLVLHIHILECCNIKAMAIRQHFAYAYLSHRFNSNLLLVDIILKKLSNNKYDTLY